MAVNYSTKYPGQTATPTTEYPFGAARNDLTLDDGTGTPLEEDWVNDWFGFGAYWLTVAGTTPSGTPENATASQIADAMKATTPQAEAGTNDTRFMTPLKTKQAIHELSIPTWTNGDIVGTALTIASSSFPSLAALGSSAVAYIDGTNQNLEKYQLSSGSWSKVGNSLPVAISINAPICALSNNTVALLRTGATDELRVYEFDGTDWAQSGSGLTVTGDPKSSLTTLTSTTIAYYDVGSGNLGTYEWSGSVFSLVGSELNIPSSSTGAPAISALNEDTIAFYDVDIGELRAYRFDGSLWSQVGSSLALSAASNVFMASLNEYDVAISGIVSDKINIFRFDGSAFFNVTDGVAEISGKGTAAMASLNGTDIACFDSTDDELFVVQYRFSVGPLPRNRQVTG